MFTTETLIGWGLTGAAIVGHIFVANYRIERNEKESTERDKSQKDALATERAERRQALEEVWQWKNNHEKDAGNMREKYQNQLAELRGSLLVTGEQFKQIMGALDDIKERITALENHKNNHG